MNSSVEYYNKIAALYPEISNERSNYLKAVDNIVFQSITKCTNYLDVGSGDGLRAIAIAKQISCKSLCLVDNSSILENLVVKPLDYNFSIQKVMCSILELDIKEKFDVITCLWNVFGHIGSLYDRERALQNIKKHLSSNGHIIIDVNNRYNIAHYGKASVMDNYINDHTNNVKAGWFEIDTQGTTTSVYIHAPLELDDLCSKVGLAVKDFFVVDYSTGSIMNNFFDGQLVYVITHK